MTAGLDEAPVGRDPAAQGGGALGPRLVSGVALAALALAALVLGGWGWRILLSLIALGLALEWVRLVRIPGTPWSGLALGLVLWLSLGLGIYAQPIVSFIFLTLLALLLMLAAAVRLDRNSFWLALGLLYIGLPIHAVLWLRALPAPMGLVVTLWLLLVVWATDSAAYFAGRGLGGPKLLPSISPKKTWSGFFGGLVAAAMVGALMDAALDLSASAPALAGASMAVSLIAQVGDALESALKRAMGVKDSGRIIPGHGGLFDRLDGLLLAAPLVALALAAPIGETLS
ncbi:MAG: phosphatidate cytidylyltransferase [Pseudomonadota bacterium]